MSTVFYKTKSEYTEIKESIHCLTKMRPYYDQSPTVYTIIEGAAVACLWRNARE